MKLNNLYIKNTLIVMIFSIIAKVFALYRETLIALEYGVSYETDIYLFSADMVTVIFATIGAGLLTTFIPILSEYIKNNNKEEKSNFLNSVISFIIIFSIIMVVIGFIFSKFIIIIFAPGFIENNDIFNKSIDIMRIMIFSLLFIGLQNIITGILQTHKKYLIPSILNVVMSLILIIYLIFLNNKFGIYGFAIITVIGNFIILIIQIPTFLKLGYRYKFEFNLHNSGLKRMIKLMFPIILSTSIAQINFSVNRIFATNIGEGAVSVLSFANKINMIFYSVFIMAISSVIYPSMSKLVAEDKMKEYKEMLFKSINIVLILIIPATMLVIIFRYEIISILFVGGKFNTDDAALTANALLFYSPGIIAYSLRDILDRAFYSLKDTKTPMINSIIGVFANIVLTISLSKILKIDGLAMASSISAIITTILLMFSLMKKMELSIIKSILNSFLKVIFAAIIMAITSKFLYNNVSSIYNISKFESALYIVISSILGVGIYFILLYLLNIYNLKYKIKLIKKQK